MMRTTKFWYAWLATAIVMTIYIFAVQSVGVVYVGSNPFFQTVPRTFELVWSFLVAAVGSFMYVWLYQWLGRGMRSWRFGLFIGIFVSFQLLVGNQLFVVGYPYPFGWPWVFGFVGVYLVSGFVVDVFYKR